MTTNAKGTPIATVRASAVRAERRRSTAAAQSRTSAGKTPVLHEDESDGLADRGQGGAARLHVVPIRGARDVAQERRDGRGRLPARLEAATTAHHDEGERQDAGHQRRERHDPHARQAQEPRAEQRDGRQARDAGRQPRGRVQGRGESCGEARAGERAHLPDLRQHGPRELDRGQQEQGGRGRVHLGSRRLVREGAAGRERPGGQRPREHARDAGARRPQEREPPGEPHGDGGSERGQHVQPERDRPARQQRRELPEERVQGLPGGMGRAEPVGGRSQLGGVPHLDAGCRRENVERAGDERDRGDGAAAVAHGPAPASAAPLSWSASAWGGAAADGPSLSPTSANMSPGRYG